jgi:CheY-like chemotaxis protein
LTADSGDHAIAIFKKNQPIDLLLTDVVAPGMSGPMLAEKLTELQPGLKVLFMSGYDNTHVVKQYVEKQGHALLRKPFDLETLGEKVQDMLENDKAGAKP